MGAVQPRFLLPHFVFKGGVVPRFRPNSTKNKRAGLIRAPPHMKCSQSTSSEESNFQGPCFRRSATFLSSQLVSQTQEPRCRNAHLHRKQLLRDRHRNGSDACIKHVNHVGSERRNVTEGVTVCFPHPCCFQKALIGTR